MSEENFVNDFLYYYYLNCACPVMTTSVNFSLYLFNLLNAFTQLFVMMKQHRHKYWVKSHILNRISASRDVKSRNLKRLIKLLFTPDHPKHYGGFVLQLVKNEPNSMP
jgi:hypothetical protein